MANVFCAVEPLVGRHFTKVTDRRTKPDFAKFLKDVSAAYPCSKKITVVMDNLNTHNESSLLEKYGDKQGAKIWARFDVHYTPKHASEDFSNFRDLGFSSSPEVYGLILGAEFIGSINEKLVQVHINVEPILTTSKLRY